MSLTLEFDLNKRRKAKVDQVLKRLGQPCRFIPQEGAPFERCVNIRPTHRDENNDYVNAPVTLAEFLHSEGRVQADDTFAIESRVYRLTELYESDQTSVTYIYVET